MLILDQLKEGNGFTTTDAAIAKFILDHREEVTHMSLTELSQVAFCSEAAIIRLCKKVGCSGFPKLKIELVKEVNAYGDAINVSLDVPFDKNATPEEVIHSLSSISRKAISDMEAAIDLKNLEKAASMMMNAKHIHFFGQDQSLIIAHDLRYKLLRIGMHADCDSIQGFSNLYAYNLNENDVAVVISHYVSSYDVLRWIALLKEKHVPMILLTCMNDLPFEIEDKDVIIQVTNAETNRNIGSFSGRNGMIYACDCLFGLIFVHDYEKNKEYLLKRIDTYEKINHDISNKIK